jgi:hypothetical protein
MDDRTVVLVRRGLKALFAALALVLIVLTVVTVRGSSESKAERLHSVRSVSLSATGCQQWRALTADVQWISTYRQLGTLRYEAQARNRQPTESEVDSLVEDIASRCAVPQPDGSELTAKEAAVQAVAERPALLSD